MNRILREAGYIALREEQGLELLDPGASRAFAVSDHQIAHVYIQDAELIPTVKALFEQQPGIARVLDAEGKRELGLDHERSGELVLLAEANAWFTYYYWFDDAVAPDYARLVDIHRKPGYDPVEMFMNPKNPLIKLRAAYKLARKLLGFRYLMDVIPLDATLVKGSHGGINIGKEYYPILVTDKALDKKEIDASEVYQVIWEHLVN